MASEDLLLSRANELIDKQANETREAMLREDMQVLDPLRLVRDHA